MKGKFTKKQSLYVGLYRYKFMKKTKLNLTKTNVNWNPHLKCIQTQTDKNIHHLYYFHYFHPALYLLSDTTCLCSYDL